jgi:hypothetical protein
LINDAVKFKWWYSVVEGYSARSNERDVALIAVATFGPKHSVDNIAKLRIIAKARNRGTESAQVDMPDHGRN